MYCTLCASFGTEKRACHGRIGWREPGTEKGWAFTSQTAHTERLSCLLWHENKYRLLAWFDERQLPLQLEHHLCEEIGKQNVLVNCSYGIGSSIVSWWWTRNSMLAICDLYYWLWRNHTLCLADRHVYTTLVSSSTLLRIDCFSLRNICISNNICRVNTQLVEGASH